MGTNIAYKYYRPHCPVCHSGFRVKPDDSFLKAMVSEEQLESIQKAKLLTEKTELLVKFTTILKPFHVLVDMPCEVCHQKINDRTEDKVMRFATGLGWAHEECRKTFTGRMRQLGIVTPYIPRVEEEQPQPKEEGDGIQPGH